MTETQKSTETESFPLSANTHTHTDLEKERQSNNNNNTNEGMQHKAAAQIKCNSNKNTRMRIIIETTEQVQESERERKSIRSMDFHRRQLRRIFCASLSFWHDAPYLVGLSCMLTRFVYGLVLINRRFSLAYSCRAHWSHYVLFDFSILISLFLGGHFCNFNLLLVFFGIFCAAVGGHIDIFTFLFPFRHFFCFILRLCPIAITILIINSDYGSVPFGRWFTSFTVVPVFIFCSFIINISCDA